MTEGLGPQIAELTAVHKGLTNIVERDGDTIVFGALPFEASAEGLETIAECFDIELAISKDFPETLPSVRETGGRIAKDYEHRNPSGTLCLAVPIEQRRVFLDQPTLLGFVNRLVIPYLYGYCFFKKHGCHPFNEAAHGHEGILRHYADTLGLRDDLAALAVICFLVEHGYRGHHTCPCGSCKKVRDCHGPALLALHRTHNSKSAQRDFLAILEICVAKVQDGKIRLPTSLRDQVVRVLGRFKK